MEPLQGWRIVVTRSPHQAARFGRQLADLGAVPVILPVIDFEPICSPELTSAITDLERYDWLVFTSVNAVRFFWQQLQSPPTSWPKIAAVGSATAELLEAKGVAIDFMPAEFTGERLVLGLGDLTGRSVLLPRAKIGRPEIVGLLRDRGAAVTDIPLYDTVTAQPTAGALAQLRAGFDLITFTSPSSVRNFLKILENAAPDLLPLMQKIPIIVIGPVTAAEVAKQGLPPAMIAKTYTIEGMIEVMIHMVQLKGETDV